MLRKAWEDKLAQQRDAGLWRTHRVRNNSPIVTPFNSNDYLGMSNHPQVIEAFKQAADQYGVGSGSANTLSGYTQAHDELRQTLREWLGRDEVLLFSSGYQANLAVLTTLISKNDHIFADKLNHASLNDGMRFSGARFTRYKHCGVLDKALCACSAPHWIISESLFSMDGDMADLQALSAFSDKATIMVDEAHSLGLYGPQGAGMIAEHQLTQQHIPLMIGTFGKSIGTQGAFVAGDKVLLDALMQFGRPYLFTTAMAPALAAASTTAIKLIQHADDDRAYLQDLISYFRTSAERYPIKLGASSSAIQPILFNDIAQVNRLSEFLSKKGIGISSIRYPTVPLDAPRLRVTLTKHHTTDMIDYFFEILQEALDEEAPNANRI